MNSPGPASRCMSPRKLLPLLLCGLLSLPLLVLVPTGTADAGSRPPSPSRSSSPSRHANLTERETSSRPAPRLTEPLESGFREARWAGDSEALVEFRPMGSNGVEISIVRRGDQPRGTGGLMIADALKAAGIHQPTTIRGTNIKNTPSLEAVARGEEVDQTVLGKALKLTAEAMGGSIIGWELAPNFGRGEWAQITLDYRPRRAHVPGAQPLIPIRSHVPGAQPLIPTRISAADVRKAFLDSRQGRQRAYSVSLLWHWDNQLARLPAGSSQRDFVNKQWRKALANNPGGRPLQRAYRFMGSKKKTMPKIIDKLWRSSEDDQVIAWGTDRETGLEKWYNLAKVNGRVMYGDAQRTPKTPEEYFQEVNPNRGESPFPGAEHLENVQVLKTTPKIAKDAYGSTNQ
jgi:hypothetical protein